MITHDSFLEVWPEVMAEISHPYKVTGGISKRSYLSAGLLKKEVVR